MNTNYSSNYHVLLFKGEAGEMPNVEAIWSDCISRCPASQHLFTYEWIAAWIRTYGSRSPWDGCLRVFAVQSQVGETVALLPLAQLRERGLRIWSLAGFYQPLRTLICEPACADVAGSLLTDILFTKYRNWDILRFSPFDVATPERDALYKALRTNTCRIIEIPMGRTIVNRLHDSFEMYEKKRAFKRIRSYERKFLRQRSTQIQYWCNPDPQDVDHLIAELATVERNSWLAKQGGDLRFVSDTDRVFWRDVIVNSLTPRKQFDVWMAYVNGKPVAFRVVLTSGPIAYLIANQYDEKFAKYRLGWILYLRHLQHAVDHGVEAIDSAPGDIHYKRRLGGKEAEMRKEILVFPRGVRGAILYVVFRLLRRLKAVLGASSWSHRLTAYIPGVRSQG